VDIKGRPDLMIAAVATKERLKNYPQAPTFSEMGYDLTDDVLWRGYALRSGTDPQAQEYLENIFKKVSADPEWRRFVENTAAQPVFIGGRDFERMVQKDQTEAKKYLALAGILPEEKTAAKRQKHLFAFGFLIVFILLLSGLFFFKREWLRPEVIISLFLVLMSVYLYWLTFDFPQGKLSRTAGPAAMPRLWLWGIAIFSLWLIVDSLRKEKKENAKSYNMKKALMLAFLTAIYLSIISFLGYYVSTFLFLIAGAYLLLFRKHLIILITSAGFSLFSYFVFYKILGVPLPLGIFG